MKMADTLSAETKGAVHGNNAVDMGGEFTVCGLSFDAHETGDADHPVVMAQSGQTVTCEACRKTIAFMKTFTRWKQP